MNILLGVSGGVSCYKALDLISKLKYKGHSVRVVMTANAERLVTSAQFASLTGFPVLKDLWEEAENGEIDHINIPQKWAHLLVIAPATANVIGKFAHGLADDYLSTLWLATNCKKIIAPAMNTVMWNNSAVQWNLDFLKSDGVIIVPPASGKLACGTVGPGKLAKVNDIIKVIEEQYLACHLDAHFQNKEKC